MNLLRHKTIFLLSKSENLLLKFEKENFYILVCLVHRLAIQKPTVAFHLKAKVA